LSETAPSGPLNGTAPSGVPLSETVPFDPLNATAPFCVPLSGIAPFCERGKVMGSFEILLHF
jgi:hypothetical protein